MKSIGFALAAVVAIAACGGGSKKKAAQPAAESPPAISNTVVEEPPPAEPRPDEKIAKASTGASACDEYLALMDRLIVECQKELGPALDAMKQSVDAQRESFKQWDQLDPESRAATIEAATSACQSATDAVRQAAASMNCMLSSP